ncbi:glycosyltransferase [uncultured Jatrophihabitans sp.]|uniref:glycosyltransferase n=1 Tax=uncultured Jatrophihabitans sp. TaxID=1610747 RepID=UPI0035CC27E7
MRTAVVTVVAGRHEHLRVQRAFLAACDPAPDLHVVVAVDDPAVVDVCAAEAEVPTVVVQMPTTAGGLPVAAARNRGAGTALQHDAELLVFLDVDCIPAPDLLGRYRDAVTARPDAVISGPVTYLPQSTLAWTHERLASARNPHEARPDPADGVLIDLAAQLFWSLSFAVAAPTWLATGGFYEGYVGYGGEDTDFAVTADTHGVPLLMAGGADAFHQHHPAADPPVAHLDDIVRNSHVYARRHSTLPMGGWLAGFRDRGLLGAAGDLPRRADPVRVVTVPAWHEYLDAVVPGTVDRTLRERVTGWTPDPLLEPDVLRANAHAIDVVHLHFGYEHLTADALHAWLACLDELGIALVVTVHDLRNPHQLDREPHDAHLRMLFAAAQQVLTLTAAAAGECAERFGRRPEVAPHPTVVDIPDTPPTAPDTAPRHVVVPLKALRANVVDPVEVVRAVGRGAGKHDVRVLVEPHALDRPELAGLRDLGVRLDVRGRMSPRELVDYVAAAHAWVLPYRFGTHSGWVELGRDLGTHVVAPDCGHYAGQWDDVVTYVGNERHGLDQDSLAAAVRHVCRRPPARPADREQREAERDVVRAMHDAVYRQVSGR